MATREPILQEDNKLPPVVLRDFSGGIHTNVSSALVNPNVLKYVVNMYNDPENSVLGLLTSRRGFAVLYGNSIDVDIAGVDPDDEITGLHAYKANEMVVAVTSIGANTQRLYRYESTFWAEIGAAPLVIADSTTPVRFITYKNSVDGKTWVFLIAPGTFKSWDSSALANNWGTTHLSGAPTNPVVIEIFNGKIYTAVGNKINFSSLPNTTTGVYSWVATDNFSINVSGADSITGLEANGIVLLIFFHNSLFVYDGVQIQSDQQFKVGAVNQEVIQTIDDATYFVSEDKGGIAVYKYAGGYPIKISDPIKDFLRSENMASFDSISDLGAWTGAENYYVSIGDVTIQGQLIQNVILCYSTKQNSWTVLSIKKESSKHNNFFRFSTTYYHLAYSDSTNSVNFTDLYNDKYVPKTIIAGTPLGSSSTNNFSCAPVQWLPKERQDYSPVIPVENGDDIGDTTNNPIEILIQTHELEFGSRSTLKQINKFFIYASGNYGIMNVEVRIDGGNWISLGGLTGKTTEFELSTQGYYFEFKLIGSNTGEQFIFEGFEFPNITVEPYES